MTWHDADCGDGDDEDDDEEDDDDDVGCGSWFAAGLGV